MLLRLSRHKHEVFRVIHPATPHCVDTEHKQAPDNRQMRCGAFKPPGAWLETWRFSGETQIEHVLALKLR